MPRCSNKTRIIELDYVAIIAVLLCIVFNNHVYQVVAEKNLRAICGDGICTALQGE